MIPVGKYQMHNTEFQFSTYQSRKIWTAIIITTGGYFILEKFKHFQHQSVLIFQNISILKTDYTYNYVTLPDSKCHYK